MDGGFHRFGCSVQWETQWVHSEKVKQADNFILLFSFGGEPSNRQNRQTKNQPNEQ